MKRKGCSISSLGLLLILPALILQLNGVRNRNIKNTLLARMLLVAQLFKNSIIDLGNDEYYAVSIETFRKEATILLAGYNPKITPIKGYIFPGNILADKFMINISYDQISHKEVFCCAKIC